MATFGDKSQSILERVDPDLVMLANQVVLIYDITITSGFRSWQEQEMLFDMGQSKLHGGESKHNVDPAKAVDMVPFPVDWNDLNRFYFMAGLMFLAADNEGIDIRWGGDWNRNMDFKDQSFFDLPHFELV